MLLAKKILFGTLVIGATVLGCSTTKKAVITNVPVPDPRWAAIDSLAAIGQFASALDAANVTHRSDTHPRPKTVSQNRFDVR